MKQHDLNREVKPRFEYFFLGVFLALAPAIPLIFIGMKWFEDKGTTFVFLCLSILIGLCLLTGLLILFREPIFRRLKLPAYIQLSDFSHDLGKLAIMIARRDVEQLGGTIEPVSRRLLAWYSWMSLRKWAFRGIFTMLTITIALAGTVLLLEQNKLLRSEIAFQRDVLFDQKKRTRMLELKNEFDYLHVQTSVFYSRLLLPRHALWENMEQLIEVTERLAKETKDDEITDITKNLKLVLSGLKKAPRSTLEDLIGGVELSVMWTRKRNSFSPDFGNLFGEDLHLQWLALQLIGERLIGNTVIPDDSFSNEDWERYQTFAEQFQTELIHGITRLDNSRP